MCVVCEKPEADQKIHVFEEAGLGKAPFYFEDIHEGWTSCDHCGRSIYWQFSIASSDGKHFIVGSSCVAKTGDYGLISKVNAADKAAKKKRAQEKKEAGRRAMIREKARAWLLDWSSVEKDDELSLSCILCEDIEKRPYRHRILDDLAAKLWRWGSLSDNQAQLAYKIVEQLKNPPPEEVSVEVPEGRMLISGKVLSVKEQEDFRGAPVWKMLVRDDRGFKIWGTIPSGIDWNTKVRGQTVEFRATVERSPKDPCFGFFKRPTNGKTTGRWDG